MYWHHRISFLWFHLVLNKIWFYLSTAWASIIGTLFTSKHFEVLLDIFLIDCKNLGRTSSRFPKLILKCCESAIILSFVQTLVLVMRTSIPLRTHLNNYNIDQQAGEDLVSFDFTISPRTTRADQIIGIRPRRNKTKLEIPLFSFSSVSACTNNFSASNKLGEGGFGPVYKGRWTD